MALMLQRGTSAANEARRTPVLVGLFTDMTSECQAILAVLRDYGTSLNPDVQRMRLQATTAQTEAARRRVMEHVTE